MNRKSLKKAIKKLALIPVVLNTMLFQIAFAQVGTGQQAGFYAQISANPSAEVGKNVIFDGSKSVLPADSSKGKFEWDFGDGTQQTGIETVHSYTKTGVYHVILTVLSEKQTFKDTDDIFIYKKSAVLLTDEAEKRDQIENLNLIARNEGIDLKVLESYDSASEFLSEEVLTKKLSENIDDVVKSDDIIIWTHDNVGLNAIGRFLKDNSDVKIQTLTGKNYYIIDNDLYRFQQTSSLAVLVPKIIIVAKEASLFVLLPSTNESIVKTLQQGGYEFNVITDATQRLGIFNFMSYFMNYLVDSGIPDNTIVLILMLPIIASVVVFLRQVVGLNTLGLYTPLIICLTFLILGLKFGMITLLTALAVGTGTRYALKKVKLLFMPKLAIVMFMITLSLFALLIIGTSLNLFDSQFFSLAIFPMLILGSITEKFTSIQSESGFAKTIWLTLQTILIAVIAYVVVGGEIDLGVLSFRWDVLRTFMSRYPEAILLFLVLDIGLGKWTGLKLVEYFRFQEMFKHNEEE